MREMVGGCCVCSDDRGWNENPLVYCDGQSCTVAVHQACYGIVTVPSGPWFCRKCESQERSVKVKCELCPSKYGALKRTENAGWAHVVCALYIPEVRFGNVTTMEPIQLHLIPAERFNKVCYICEENSKTSNAAVGACMQCNKPGCRQSFHVTCAQSLGLLCEEAGNYLDNVKYCGYCQYHYSKLRKGGNVKAIPAYKPVSSENHLSDSSSEKETEAGSSANANSLKPSVAVSSGKKKSSSTSKTSSSTVKNTNSNSKSSASATQKTAPSASAKNADPKPKTVNNSNAKSAKGVDDSASTPESAPDAKTDKSAAVRDASESESKESKGSKKRKSRTPTPVTVVPNETVLVSIGAVSEPSTSVPGVSTNTTDKKDATPMNETLDKSKKAKLDFNQTPASQSAVAPTSVTAPIKLASSPVITLPEVPSTAASSSPTPSIIQSTSTQPLTSLVVSVPLVSTNLSPHSNTQTIGAIAVLPAVSATPFAHLSHERSSPSMSMTEKDVAAASGGNGGQSAVGVITSEMSGGGLKITYERQPASTSSLQVELERMPIPMTEQPAKRTRSQSGEKSEKSGRTKKRNNQNSNSNSQNAQFNNNSASNTVSKKAIRVQQRITPPPPLQPELGAFSAITQSQIKDSPPSSPSSESQSAPPAGRRTKSRKSAPATLASMKFHNGVHAPHMLGNQLNPNSNMAQKMSDHLNSELEAHSIFSPSDNSSSLIGPQLHHRVIASARANNAGSPSAGGLSSMLGGGGGAIPQTLDQLLERQWEQGSQFLMEQAQHFDIASLLSCLHQLRAENLRLEEHVSSLLQRRDHLLAVNARLAIPLTGQPSAPQSSHPHTVNNIHPSVAATHGDVPRSSRHSGGYPAQPQGSALQAQQPVENGLPAEASQLYATHSRRSPATSQPQPSPTVRHSSAGSGYPSSGLLRQNADTSGRSAPRPQPYPIYQGPGPSAQSQMVVRRDSDVHHHQPSSKPS